MLQVQAQKACATGSPRAACQLRCQHARRGHAAREPSRHQPHEPYGQLTPDLHAVGFEDSAPPSVRLTKLFPTSALVVRQSFVPLNFMLCLLLPCASPSSLHAPPLLLDSPCCAPFSLRHFQSGSLGYRLHTQARRERCSQDEGREGRGAGGQRVRVHSEQAGRLLTSSVWAGRGRAQSRRTRKSPTARTGWIKCVCRRGRVKGHGVGPKQGREQG